MAFIETYLLARFVTFTLVLTRVSGVVATAPIFGSQVLPARVRAMLAVALALLVTPLQPMLPTSHAPQNLVGFAQLLANELLVGLLLGWGLYVLFAGIQVTGQIISQMSGMSLADVFNPGFDANVSVFSQLLYFLTLSVFLLIGGHRLLTEALLDTFRWAPPGSAALGDSFVEAATTIVTQSFVLGLRAGAPLMISLLLSTILLGLVSRTMPQINIIAVGFGINSMLTIGVLMLSLGGIAWTFQEQTADVLELILETLQGGREYAG